MNLGYSNVVKIEFSRKQLLFLGFLWKYNSPHSFLGYMYSIKMNCVLVNQDPTRPNDVVPILSLGLVLPSGLKWGTPTRRRR